ncbi:MAG TPA: hypothetical protein VLD61_08905 [Methylomirabilota bacterium]|nr:hypothetical protein [Methylomirabilota bacterium]
MTIEEALGAAAAGAARGEVRFPQDLQGFPGTVHGGAVAALFHRLTLPRPPVHLRLELVRGVPTETPLSLTTTSAGHEARLTLAQGDRVLARATLSREVVPAADPASARAAWAAKPASTGETPGTSTCLACGSANPIGLAVRFRVGDRLLWQEYVPREAYRGRDGDAHPALAAVMLDELGWWLGALAQGECGVTTEVEVTWYGALPLGPILVIGDRSAVRADENSRGRYCRAAGILLSPGGAVLAAGRVRFAGSRAYTRRLLEPFLETTGPDTLIRLFPSAGPLLARGTTDGPSEIVT